MDMRSARDDLSRARLLAHLAPGVVTWVYVAWIRLAFSSDWSRQLFKGLYPVQLAVVVLAAVGGVCAFRLPSRRLRISVASGSLFAAILLLGDVGAVMFLP